MPAAAKTKRPAKLPRALREWSASAPAGSPLVVDRDAQVIAGVRVLGRFSRNSHGLREATGGTEYTPACMRAALPLYEGAEVLADHESLGGHTAGLKAKRTPRGVEYVVGVLREARMDGAGDAECVRADLHYFDSHPLSPRVLEDVERGLGVFGLSHDASAGRERFDPGTRRLVIESLAAVRSVDLVRKPATNRNLWESHGSPTMPTTLREQLDERRPKWSKPRRKWADRLLEDDAMAPMMDAPADAPADGGDEEDALWAGFQAAIGKILEQYKDGTLDENAAAAKVKDFLKSHKKLVGEDEPEAPADDPPAADPDKTESVKELAAVKHKLAVRELCEEVGIKTDKTLIESLEELPLDRARKLVEREKARGGSPRAGGVHGNGAGAKPAKKPTGKAFLDAITD